MRRNKLKKFVLVFTLIILLSNISSITLSLEEIKEISLKNNLDLLAEKHNWKAAELDKWNAAFGLIPSASIDGSLTQYKPDFMQAEESRSYGLSLSQPLFNGGKIWLGYRMKNDLATISEARYEDLKFQTISTAEDYYFQIMETSDLIEISNKDLESSNTNLEIAQAKFQNGTLSKADYYRIQSENASKYVNLIQIKNLLSISKIQLANFLQINNDFQLTALEIDNYKDQLELIQKLEFDDISKLKQTFSVKLDENNPSLKIAKLNRNISKKSLLMAGGNFLPSLNLSYSKSWDKYDYQDKYSDSQRLMLIASFPIFPMGDNVTNYFKARHQLKSTSYKSTIIEDAVILSLENSLSTLIASAKSVNSADLAKNYAEETYLQAQERYKNNMISTTDLIAIEVMLKSTRTDFIKSFYSFLSAKSQLMRLTQISNDTDFLKLINKSMED